MKYVAWFLVVVTLLLICAVAFLWQGAHLEVVETSSQVYGAAERRVSYDGTVQALQEGSFTGTILQDASYQMPESYAFVTYSLRLQNNGFLPAEWIEMRIVPDGADILSFDNERGHSLAAKSAGTISTTLLAYAGTQTTRTVVISYYVFGRQFELEAVIR